MSQYPYGYGQYPGQPPPAPPQYAYPNPMTYPPQPVYGAPHDLNTPLAPEGYYAMNQTQNQNTYAYNQSLPGMPGIPGLGIAGTPSAGSPYHPPPVSASPWGQPAYQNHGAPFAAGASGAASQYGVPQQAPYYAMPPPPLHVAASQPTPTRTQALQPSFQQQSQRQPVQPAVPISNTLPALTNIEMEEGELSEGQFEDLYEPREPVAQPKAKAKAPSTVPAAERSLPVSTLDSTAETPDVGFYTEDDAPSKTRSSAKKTSNGQGQSSRERSGSYSPYFSPREIQDNTRVDTAQGPQTRAPPPTASLPGFHIQKKRPVQVPGIGQQVNSMSDGSAATKSSLSQSHTLNGANPPAAAGPPFGTLAEAKKEAQKAILRLWPMGVKFQHYVDEGIDEQVVKRLFEDLHLDMSTGKPVQASVAEPSKPPAKPTVPQKPVLPASSPATEKQSLVQSTTIKPTVAGEKGDQGESRKDRIARLLAEKKAAKGPAAVPAPAAAPTSDPKAPTVNPPIIANPAHTSVPSNMPSTLPAAPAPKEKAPKSKEEIDRLLLQKMDALKKARVQKADANKSVSAPSMASCSASGIPVGTPTGPASATPPFPYAGVPTGPRGARSSLPPTVPTGPRASITPTVSAEVPVNAQKGPSPGQQAQPDVGPIPGLFLSSAPAPVNDRKRPVAADSFGGAALKRPFGQERADSSLVIDISDDEEMDIEMEMDSPTEAPASLSRPSFTVQRTMSFGKHPPLTDTLQCQTSSPGPSTQTPPVTLSKKAQLAHDLQSRERSLEELRRKIAEAEAKRKAKQASSGVQTPIAATATLSEGNGSETSGTNAARGSSANIIDQLNGPSAQLIAEAVAAESSRSSEGPQTATLAADPFANVSAMVTPVPVPAPLAPAPAPVDPVAEKKERKAREKAERLRKLQEEMARLQADSSDEDADEAMEASADIPAASVAVQKQAEEVPVKEQAEQVSAGKDVLETVLQPSEEALLEPAAATADTPEQPNQSTTLTRDAREATEEGEVAETPDAPMSDVLPPATEMEGTHDQPDVEMEGTVDDAVTENKQSKNYRRCPFPGCMKKRLLHQRWKIKKHMIKAHKVSYEEFIATQDADQTALRTDLGTAAESAQLDDTHMTGEPSVVDEQESQHAEKERSASYEPPEASAPATEQIAVPSPSPAAPTAEELILAHISDISRPRDKIQEVESISTREPRPSVAPATKMRFTPYESPLQYFRAYRFHPEYDNTVSGGLKSLTYSNRIDPSKELCPSELAGNECLLGDQCHYQHINQLNAPDDQILLELGRSDDYTGEQKTKFIQGLRELLQKFRADQVKDFDRIARGIIEFRNKFLGDASKILPLEGVTL